MDVDLDRSNNEKKLKEFPKVAPSSIHTVLYNVDYTQTINSSGFTPTPKNGEHVWDQNHIRMPFSKENNYSINKLFKTDTIFLWEMIKTSLKEPIKNTQDLETAILKYNYNYRHEWKFTALHKLFNEHLNQEICANFFNNTLPFMIDLALDLPNKVLSPIPLLRQSENKSISLSQLQIGSLLANAFFCTFPFRNFKTPNSEYNKFSSINFNELFECDSENTLEKLKCIIHYFEKFSNKAHTGVVTFTRRSMNINQCPNWSKSKKLINSIPIKVDSSGSIEDNGVDLLQVDFANKYVGGGVLRHGCVQEEIRFLICPELLVSKLFTEALGPKEALVIIGCERYSNYTGYARTFKWAGDYEDKTGKDSSGRLKCAIVAIDALNFRNPNDQYDSENINRELNKAWVGFSAGEGDHGQQHIFPGIATGNWGCGAFRGSPYLKFLLQLMVCCEARKSLTYFTFNDYKLKDAFTQAYNHLSQYNITVGDLYNTLSEAHKLKDPESELFHLMYEYLIPPHASKNQTNQLCQNLSDESGIPEALNHNEQNEECEEPDLINLTDQIPETRARVKENSSNVACSGLKNSASINQYPDLLCLTEEHDAPIIVPQVPAEINCNNEPISDISHKK